MEEETNEINFNNDDFNIFYIKHKLYEERIQNELKTLNKDSDRYKKLNNMILNISNINTNEINEISEKAFKIQCKKPWRRLPETYKITKIEEYCKEKNINDENKFKLINAVKNKKLKIADVNYDVENIKIIDINFKF